MKVKLVSITEPVGYVTGGLDTPEQLIAYCARVSNPKNQTNKEYKKLLKYLKKHGEWSPFEMVDVTFEIETTRDISRQMLRHRSFSFQEFSQRYAEVDANFEYRECRMQDPDNRQSSLKIGYNNELSQGFRSAQDHVYEIALAYYKSCLEEGIAKECARALLPEGLTSTTVMMKGSVRSWIHYLDLRKGEGTQKEHRDIAQAILKVLSAQLPGIFEDNECK